MVRPDQSAGEGHTALICFPARGRPDLKRSISRHDGHMSRLLRTRCIAYHRLEPAVIGFAVLRCRVHFQLVAHTIENELALYRRHRGLRLPDSGLVVTTRRLAGNTINRMYSMR